MAYAPWNDPPSKAFNDPKYSDGLSICHPFAYGHFFGQGVPQLKAHYVMQQTAFLTAFNRGDLTTAYNVCTDQARLIALEWFADDPRFPDNLFWLDLRWSIVNHAGGWGRKGVLSKLNSRIGSRRLGMTIDENNFLSNNPVVRIYRAADANFELYAPSGHHWTLSYEMIEGFSKQKSLEGDDMVIWEANTNTRNVALYIACQDGIINSFQEEEILIIDPRLLAVRGKKRLCRHRLAYRC